MALSDRLVGILEARGLDAELLEKLGVGNSDKLAGDAIRIPYFEGGVEVNAKHRTIGAEKRFAQEPGARKCFWNADVITDATLADQPLIVTEGELDAIAAIQAGFVRAVSVPDGAPAEAQGEDDTGAKYSYVREAKGALNDIREIILCTDADGPGVNLLADLSLRLGRVRCKWVKYPKGCKDLNDALRLYGVRGVVETINRAQWMRVDGVYRMSDLPPLPDAPAFDIGIVNLARHYKIRLGDFCVVTGIPSHGKSTFIGEVCGRMVENYGWNVAFASFEQRPQLDHRRNLRTFFNRKRVIDQYPEEIAAADGWIDDHFVFIVPSEDDDVTLAWVLERAAAAIVQHGVKIVAIDPWNEMDHTRPPDMSLTEYTGFALKQFRKLAAKYRVHVIVAAHPAKMRREKDGKIPVPGLYDISDSAHWANKADVGIVIHRPDDGTTINVVKSRYHDQIGTPGTLNATFSIDTGRYTIIEDTRFSYEAAE
jgi:twinkle protein